jgi:hypothetical protein
LQVPPQPSGSPQTLLVQLATQQLPASQVPDEQVQVPPHPLEPPQVPASHAAVQQVMPPSSDTQFPEPQSLQIFPHPSGWPQESGGQFGVHWHLPSTQIPASQGGVQQVSRHCPLLQRKPG